MTLTDLQRKAIHDLALSARELLTKDTREHLEGVYGLTANGQLEPVARLPQVREDPESAETYRRLGQFLDDEERAGLPRSEAVEKLVREAAFTHLNRLVAFKMMEARKLIRGTLDKGLNSNGFKIYLVEVEHTTIGDDAAYRRFLLWQAGQIAQEIAVLFDPDTLASRLFPRPRALSVLLENLNQPDMDACWKADETIGWVYQFFNEQEKKDVFEGLKNKRKIRRQDIPAATQLFTPNWIVRFLVQNTLGRTWVQMHPDTRLMGTDLLNYLVPLQGNVPAEPLRPVREITLLDPACGTMHFGLVAFDLFAAMYQEEIDRAGEDGWLETPSLSDSSEIAAAIVEHNLYGIDIDLRAVQLSALALYLKAKALNKNARITDSHLACADVLPLNGSRLGTFLREAQFSPLTERLIKTLWERLKDVNQFGSLLRLEREIDTLLHARGETPMLARMEAGFGADLSDEDFWAVVYNQIVNGLNEFAKRQAETGADMRFFTGEAVKGLRLLDVTLRRYDVVVANPPYSGKRNLNDTLAGFLDEQYPDTKGDLYAAFIERCAELLEPSGRLGMLTIHSFMFLSSYETMRKTLTDTMTIEVINHMGTRTFMDLSNPNAQGFVGFTLHARKPSPETLVNAIRLTNSVGGDGKREGFEHALATGADFYHVVQRHFGDIPGAPWAYWVRENIRSLFATLPKLVEIAPPKQGLATADNFRFLRYWWEIGKSEVRYECHDTRAASLTGLKWFPYMKGGDYRRWYGNQNNVINWSNDGKEIKAFERAVVRNEGYYFKIGITYSFLTSATFNARISPGGFIFDVAGSSLFPQDMPLLLAIFNSELVNYLLKLINPTVNFQVGDLARLPIAKESRSGLQGMIKQAVQLARASVVAVESAPDFTILPTMATDSLDFGHSLAELESRINRTVYDTYGVALEDRAAIEAELAGESFAADEDSETADTGDNTGEDTPEPSLSREELAVRWISYAVGVVLGRFQPGIAGALGRAVYKREDFAVGSLPAPDETEFDLLVGTADRFATIDEEGGRHVFPADVETALRNLAVPDGITVLDEGHERDLPALVERALSLMLGDAAADEVIKVGAAGDLRKFLGKDFFTGWHFRWYRKRPVYWPLQSAKRSYGFVVFHERISKYTLYSLLRDYLDYRINRPRNAIGDLEADRSKYTGKQLRELERKIEALTGEVDELAEFSKTMERIANEGYQPEPNWIDDGVILRLAPLWELLPIWKAEPKKHWEKLIAGDFDWSHIAMKYWHDRVRAKCRTNKSFAIAHGHEDWFETHT